MQLIFSKITFLLLIIYAILFASCSRKLNSNTENETTLPFNINCQKIKHIVGEGIDSQVGTIICDGYELQYDYGRYSNAKPLSLHESFSKQFYAFHYSKFFESIYVEEKVREILRDSISILNVSHKRYDEKYIVDCKPCIATAKLLFTENEFLYAFNPNEEILKNESRYNFSIEDLDKAYYKKMYTSKQGNVHGVYFAPNGNTVKSRLKNKLSLTIDTTMSNTLREILRSIELK